MENKTQIEGINYIICKVCGEKVSRIYGRYLKHHNITSQEYKNIWDKDKER